MTDRERLRRAARRIANRYGQEPYGPLTALRKLVITERRGADGHPAGWKRGELFEVLEALLRGDRAALTEEWGDLGYYLAQSFTPLWRLYAAVTPEPVLRAAVYKFMQRSRVSRDDDLAGDAKCM